MAKINLPGAITAYVRQRATEGQHTVSAQEITDHLGEPRPTVNRYLARMVVAGELIKDGRGPGTKYRKPVIQTADVVDTAHATVSISATVSPHWSQAAIELQERLRAPIGMRTPVTFQRRFVYTYRPNQSFLLPPKLAESLYAEGRMRGRQPAGTYARKVLEQLLIDLSWSSSRLEGNRYSLLDTRELFERGPSAEAAVDIDAVMLLNHKDAIEFMVDAVPTYGLTVPVVRNIHSVLMQNLLAQVNALGTIRTKVVNISDSVYVPTQVAVLLEEMLRVIIDKAQHVKNPVEAAFFLWVNLAYLQPFEDGNKRTSRLSANVPLMLSNCAPLSFLDVSANDYAEAMLGVYELLDITMAAELFAWTYRRSLQKYTTVLESMGNPDPFRAKYRERLGDAVRGVILDGQTIAQAAGELKLLPEDEEPFQKMLRDELQHLDVHNCARYRLPISKTEEWVSRGRPVDST